MKDRRCSFESALIDCLSRVTQVFQVSLYASQEDEVGMTREEITEQFPGYILPRECYKSGWWLGGREGDVAIGKRASRVVRRLWGMSAQTDGLRVVAIVSHGHFIGRVLQELLGPQAKFVHFNTGITCFDLPANQRLGPSIHYLNRIPLNEGAATVFGGGGAST